MSDLTTLEQLERRVGQKPDNASFTLTASNREAVEDWLIAQGFDETRIRSARDGLICSAYSDPNYRRKLKHRGDYYPPAGRTTQETETCKPTAQTPNREPSITSAASPPNGSAYPVNRATHSISAPIIRSTGGTPSSAENGRETTTPISDHAAVLASAIQALAGHGITEQRVIALIEKHVPAIVRQVLSEAMAAVAVNLDME